MGHRQTTATKSACTECGQVGYSKDWVGYRSEGRDNGASRPCCEKERGLVCRIRALRFTHRPSRILQETCVQRSRGEGTEDGVLVGNARFCHPRAHWLPCREGEHWSAERASPRAAGTGASGHDGGVLLVDVGYRVSGTDEASRQPRTVDVRGGRVVLGASSIAVLLRLHHQMYVRKIQSTFTFVTPDIPTGRCWSPLTRQRAIRRASSASRRPPGGWPESWRT
jgi:hypothetical protein